jgi:ADP-ribose pyrophosphatase YjhB (NUDIX family)
MPSIGVFAAIFDEPGRIFCIKRNDPPFNWTTPGRGIENRLFRQSNEKFEKKQGTLSRQSGIDLYRSPALYP